MSASNTNPRQAAIVLGMHRSGTSALTGALARLGFAPPRTKLVNAEDNPEGFYESSRIVQRNYQLLAAEQCAWNACFTLEPAELQARMRDSLNNELYQILLEEFGNHGAFVLKDPRLCLLLPLWYPGLARLSSSQHILLIARHPAEVARSHAARGGHAEPETLLNWLHHMLEAENVTRALPRAVLLYEDLLQDWRKKLTRALYTTGIIPPRTLEEAGVEIDQFISPSMRHHHIPAEGARIGPDHLAPLLDASWRAFRALAEQPQDSFALETLNDVRLNLRHIRQTMVRQGVTITLPPAD